MPRKKHLIDKKIFKQSEGKCRICGLADVALLDVHRVKPGAEGGLYAKGNVTALCANCHRKVHDGQIKIDRYYLCTDGTQKLLITMDGKESFV